jgi:hypothetical protein
MHNMNTVLSSVQALERYTFMSAGIDVQEDSQAPLPEGRQNLKTIFCTIAKLCYNCYVCEKVKIIVLKVEQDKLSILLLHAWVRD